MSNLGEDLGEYMARLSLDSSPGPPSQPPSLTSLADLPVVPPHLHKVLLRRAYDVYLVDISPLGFVVQLPLPQHLVPSWAGPNTPSNPLGAPSSTAFGGPYAAPPPFFPPFVLGLLPWASFPANVRQNKSMEELMQAARKRFPVGSKLNVYVNAIEDCRLLLTLATKPSPIINVQYAHFERGSTKFRYLIVIDLEATCDFSPQPELDFDSTEIIEFPYVVVDTETMQTIYEKQNYIKPSNMLGITPYCKVLTSITEEEVKDAMALEEAVKEFDDYLAKNLPEGSYCLISDGIWDVSCQLKQESKRKGITLPKWAKKYYDLKSEFRKFLPWFPFSVRDPPLQIMLQALQLDFVGKHHRGIDDCHSIAQVVKVMLNMGHHFGDPIEIPEDYDPLKDPSFRPLAAKAPPDAWKCEVCTAKYADEASKTNPYRAVWNKPLASSCRFCKTPPSSGFARYCSICNAAFTLTPKEMAYYQSKNWYYPKNCSKCRYKKTQIFVPNS